MKQEQNEELQKYFDPKQYATKIIGKDETPEEDVKKESKISQIISLLTDPAHKALKEDTLLSLKKEKKGELLLLAIASPKVEKNRHQLVAACWESEIDFSKYLSFFALLALDADYLVSLEAITVISTMTGPFDQEKVKESIRKIKEAQKNITSERTVLLTDLLFTLEGFLTH